MPGTYAYDYVVTFDDASCTQQATGWFQERDPDFFAILGQSCGLPTVHRNLGVSASTALYVNTPPCTFVGGSSGRILQLTPPLDIVVLERNIGQRGNRIEAMGFTSSGFDTVPRAFFDTAMSAPCLASQVQGTDEVECSLQIPSSTNLFSDPSCTVPIEVTGAGCDIPLLARGFDGQVHQVDGIVSPVYAMGATCVPDSRTWAVLGAVVPFQPARGRIVRAN